jgi:hypothetical protein
MRCVRMAPAPLGAPSNDTSPCQPKFPTRFCSYGADPFACVASYKDLAPTEPLTFPWA